MLLVTEDAAFAPIRDVILAVVLSVVLANEILGPVLTRRAILRSGEAGQDRPRLLDFLHEEHIVTGLDARTKEEAITRLTDHLIRTRKLRVDRDVLLQGFLDREAQQSTCLGEGLAIPHGPLPRGTEMVGVMGLSRRGMPLPTPDGRPVHCMVLLATPEGQEDRHLMVLAALARAIGTRRDVQEELYEAESPGHAYELLHAGEGAGDLDALLDGGTEPT
jgi:mannitol/fructose-specific phosphotransferase system IIA component (Ntr-type)